MKRVEEFVEQAVTIPDISIAENDHWLIVNVLQWLIRKGSRAGAALLNKIRETKGLFPREKIELFKKVTDKMVQAGGGEWLVQSCDHLIRTGENLDDTEEQAEAFVIIARLLLDMHESEAAQDLLERSLTLTEGVQDDLTKSLISSRIAEVLAQIPDKDWAKSGLQRLIHVVEGIADAWWKAWALGAVARAARGMGDVATGRALLEQMIPVAAGIAEAYGKAEAMGALAQAAGGLADVASGRALLEQMIPVAAGSDWVLEAVVRAAAELGELGLCERIIPDIRDDQLASEAISAYTVTVAMKRSLDEVLHLVQTISVFGVRMECIRKLAGRWGIKKPPPDPLQRGNKERLKAILPLAVEDLNTGYVVLSELLPFYDDPQALIDAAKILGGNISS